MIKKIAGGFGILVAVLLLFILEESIRGRIALHSYLRELRARSEKLTLADFDLPTPFTESNGASALLALTNQFDSLRRDCPFEPSLTVSAIKLVGPGRALVRCWQPDLGTNLRRPEKEEFVGNLQSRRAMIGRDGTTNLVISCRAGWTNLQEQIHAASNTLDQIRAALAQPTLSVAIDYSPGLDVKLPHLTVVRAAANWLALSALNELHQHNLPAATEEIVRIASLTRFQKDEKFLISQILRQRIAETGLALTWEALQTNGWTDAQLVDLQRAWQSFNVIHDVLLTAEMDRLFFRKLFEQTRHFPTWNEIGGGLYNWRAFFEDVPGSIRAVLWLLAWRDQDELRYLQRCQLMLGHARDAVEQRAWVAFALSDKDFPYANSFYDRCRYVLSNYSLPPWGTAVRKMFQFETQREMTVAAIAIKRYQLRTEKLPADLATLVPEYLSELPHDWMDGQPLRYHPNPDGTFTLYSVGADGHDDGGDPAPADGRRPISIWDGRDAVWPKPVSPAEIAETQSNGTAGVPSRGIRTPR
jgi:hypothetical protein